jgi:hypothetical protein
MEDCIYDKIIGNPYRYSNPSQPVVPFASIVAPLIKLPQE